MEIMTNIIKLLLLFFFFLTTMYSQNLSQRDAETFIDLLINESKDLEKFFDTEELSLSKRLGIKYLGIKHKFLISNNIDNSIKKRISNNQAGFKYIIQHLENNYSKLVLEIPKEKVKLGYIFHNSKLISKPNYYSRDWAKLNSKYFIFHPSDSTLLNPYSIKNLDAFVDRILAALKFNDVEIKKLEDEKIHYFLCKDESEIKQLTSYASRGQYYLANDYIISTFNNHYHEIIHLLINYKLKTNNLYTLPILQEGVAVAFGGRGGKEPKIILDMGAFLVRSNFLDYKMLLSKSDFYQYDASMSYPVAGLYVIFLIESLGIEEFLKLYIKYSSDAVGISQMQIDLNELPINTDWEKYVTEIQNERLINISEIDENKFASELIENENIIVYENKTEYLIKLKNSIGLKQKNNHYNYNSKLFSELFPSDKYQNEKYIILSNSEEVSIYNLFTNNLLAKYVRGFSTDNKSVQQKSGYHIFSIKKNLFDESLESMQFVRINTL